MDKSEKAPRRALRNPVIRWATDPAYNGAVLYLDDVQHPVKARIPLEGERLVVPFLVDPVTRQPRPVRVVSIQYQETPERTIVIPVTVPDQST